MADAVTQTDVLPATALELGSVSNIMGPSESMVPILSQSLSGAATPQRKHLSSARLNESGSMAVNGGGRSGRGPSAFELSHLSQSENPLASPQARHLPQQGEFSPETSARLVPTQPPRNAQASPTQPAVTLTDAPAPEAHHASVSAPTVKRRSSTHGLTAHSLRPYQKTAEQQPRTEEEELAQIVAWVTRWQREVHEAARGPGGGFPPLVVPEQPIEPDAVSPSSMSARGFAGVVAAGGDAPQASFPTSK
jgi:hypothetical protein